MAAGLLVLLIHVQAVARFADELRRPRLTGRGDAVAQRVAVELVDPQQALALVRALGGNDVDRLR